MDNKNLHPLKDYLKSGWNIVTGNENIGAIFKLHFIYFLVSLVAGILGTIVYVILIISVIPFSFEPQTNNGYNSTISTSKTGTVGRDLSLKQYPITPDGSQRMSGQPLGYNHNTPSTRLMEPTDPQIPNIPPALIPVLIIMVAILVIFFLIYIYVYTISQTYLVLSLYQGKPESARALVTKSFPKIFKVYILLFLQQSVVFLGLLLFIVPGIIWSIKYMFSIFILLEENCSPVEAMKRSSGLTVGYKAELFKKLVALTSIQLMLIGPIIFAMFIGNGQGVSGLALILYSTFLQMLYVSFYYDLKKIKGSAVVASSTGNTPLQTSATSAY